MKDTIFISHATPSDNTFAVWLATKLELCGYKVWVDVNNLPPSVDFWNTIDHTIRNEAAKFIFVTSIASIDPNRDGVQKELAVADKVRKQSPNFIVPVRIDNVDFNDLPVEILRLNAVDFYNNWAKGLDELLKYLSDENVPKPKPDRVSQYYVDRWYMSQSQFRSQITDDEDEYCSNFFPIDLPPLVYIYRTDDVESLLKERHIPMKKNKNVVVTFACNKCVFEWAEREIDFLSFVTVNAIENYTIPKIYLGEEVSNLSRDIIYIINWSISEMFYRHGMRRYRVDSGKMTKSVYYFTYGVKSKRFSGNRLKALSGIYKGTRRWHFGLSGYYTRYPAYGVIFKWHLVFTDSAGRILSEASQIAARRSKGRLMFNKQWKEWLQASMFYLSSGTSNIFYTACCEENAMYIRSQSERFIAEKSYIEPYIYKRVSSEDDE